MDIEEAEPDRTGVTSRTCLALAGIWLGVMTCTVQCCSRLSGISHAITFGIVITGLYLHLATSGGLAAKFLLSFGLYGFVCGTVNFIVLRALFHGVLLHQFIAMRPVIKSAIMDFFFDKDHLDNYFQERICKLFIEYRLRERMTVSQGKKIVRAFALMLLFRTNIPSCSCDEHPYFVVTFLASEEYVLVGRV